MITWSKPSEITGLLAIQGTEPKYTEGVVNSLTGAEGKYKIKNKRAKRNRRLAPGSDGDTLAGAEGDGDGDGVLRKGDARVARTVTKVRKV
jgi:hypothetical protein